MTLFATGVPRFVSVQGANIHYQDYNADDSHKPSLLLIHGLWAHLHWWDHIVPHFLDRFRVIAMDLGGMGDSDSRTTYTVRGFAEEIIGVIEDANLAPAIIVAHSFGGSPTAFACHMRPDLISRAVIIDSRLYLRNMPELRPHEIKQMNVKQKIYLEPEHAIDRYRLIPSGGFVAPDILRHIAAKGLRKEEGGWIWKFDPSIDPELNGDLDRFIPQNIRTPIDYIFGENSDVVSRELVELVHSYFPGCGEPIGIPGAKHHIILEQHELIVAVLRSLFTRYPCKEPA